MIEWLTQLLENGQSATNIPWILWIIIAGLIVRLALIPLTRKRYHQNEVLKQIAPAIKQMHEQYADTPTEYRKHFLELYKRNKVNPLTPIVGMLFTAGPLVILGYALFSLRRDLNNVFVGDAPITLGVLNAHHIEPLIVWLLSIFLVGLSGWLSARAVSSEEKQVWTTPVLIALPVMLQVIFGLFLPMYFVIYIGAMVVYGIVEQAAMRRMMAKRPPVEVWLPAEMQK